MHHLNTVRCFIALLIITLVACEGNKSEKDSGSSGEEMGSSAPGNPETVKNSPPTVGSLTGDTLNIGGKFVLFFGPVETGDSTMKMTPEVLRTFKATSAALLDSLSSNADIKAIYSTAPVFRIYTANGSVMIISKSALNEEAGMLMTDGSQPPTIKKGVLTSNEYHRLIKNYFFLK